MIAIINGKKYDTEKAEKVTEDIRFSSYINCPIHFSCKKSLYITKKGSWFIHIEEFREHLGLFGLFPSKNVKLREYLEERSITDVESFLNNIGESHLLEGYIKVGEA